MLFIEIYVGVLKFEAASGEPQDLDPEYTSFYPLFINQSRGY